MQPNELFHAVTAAFPRSFKPHEQWRDSFMDEVEPWAPHERVDAYKALKKAKSAAAAISLDDLRRARGGVAASSGALTAVSYTRVWLDYCRDERLYEALKTMGVDIEVFTRRLVGVLWVTRSDWRRELDLIAGVGEPEDRLWRLYDYAKNNALCHTQGSEGWKLPGKT